MYMYSSPSLSDPEAYSTLVSSTQIIMFLYASCVVIFIDLSKRDRRKQLHVRSIITNTVYCIPSVCMWLNYVNIL